MVPYLRWDDRVGAWRTGKTEIALAWRCACPLFCLIVTNDQFFAPDRAKLVQFNREQAPARASVVRAGESDVAGNRSPRVP